ncbi:MAG TPA: DUF1254 domain-containing protein [Rhizomicrobium sp.]|nr:DUF1254 domain-containing protein [Rhizomicrobium sp.]
MRKIWPWIVATLVVAAVVHGFTLVAAPGFIMGKVLARMGPVNQMQHQGQVTAASRQVVRPSPDLLYSICPFDLSAGPLRVTAKVPPGTYWSVSIFDADTNNVFVRNDRQVQGGIDLVLVRKADAGRAVPKGATAVPLPSVKGLVLFRTLIQNEADFAAIDAVRRQARCGTLR